MTITVPRNLVVDCPNVFGNGVDPTAWESGFVAESATWESGFVPTMVGCDSPPVGVTLTAGVPEKAATDDWPIPEPVGDITDGFDDTGWVDTTGGNVVPISGVGKDVGRDVMPLGTVEYGNVKG